MSELKELYKYLADNNFYEEIYENGNGTLSIEITWGDWKHDHMFCDYLMREKGYRLIDEDVTEENGSDCYSSIHTYKKFSLKEVFAR